MSVSKRFTFTCNNYNDDNIAALAALPCKYLCYSKEIAPETSTPHLQGYVVFTTGQRLTGAIKKLPGCHVEIAKGTTEQNITYCSKSSDLIEIGERPMSQKDKGLKGKEYWTDVIRSCRAGTCEEEYPQEFFNRNNTALKLYAPVLSDLPAYSGLWFHGPPGSGKSRAARSRFPGLYWKLLNKWWDGYIEEETVLLDDVSLDHAFLGSHLKQWVDHYPFRAEIKGGSKMIRPKCIVVTSNYTIEEIWSSSPVLCEAISRRFTCEFFPGPPPAPSGWITGAY